MMEQYITDITELNKKKLLVYINGEPAFALYKGEDDKLDIKPDMIFTDDKKELLYGDVLYKRALNRGLGLIRQADRTKHEIRVKLSGEYYPSEVVEKVLEELSDNSFVNDRRYAENYLSCYAESKSIVMIRQTLLQKGVDKAIIEDAISQYEQDNPEKERELICRLLRSRYDPEITFDSENEKYKFKSKVFSYLLRKGFSYDKVDEAVKMFFDI